MKEALGVLAALGHRSRLELFRLLVRAGPAGLPAGELARDLGQAASTVSTHLKRLTEVGLATCERQGRVLRYGINVDCVQALFWFLGEDCCQGRLELCPPPTFRIQQELEGLQRGPRAGLEQVLFICSRNSARSQMAEAILRHLAPERFRVASAGIRASEVHPWTLEVLQEREVDGSMLEAKDLGEFLGKGPIDTAIIVCERAKEHCAELYPFAQSILEWPFPDPVEADEAGQLRAFRVVRDQIWDKIESWLEEAASGYLRMERN